MSMIEVDPKLFNKCRLCLDLGHYQIVPKVQMQIKYCFDIDVEPFDGLPQLICKKCEAILTQYAGMKQIFQERQKSLKSKLNSNDNECPDSVSQQQDTVSSTQADTENRNKLDEINAFNKKLTATTRRSSSETVISNHSEKENKTTPLSKNQNKAWQVKYIKKIICRYCSKPFKDKKGMNNHLHKQCKLYAKYSNITSSFCLVGLNKIGSMSNITGSKDNVVYNKNRIIQSKRAAYYTMYTLKSKEQNSSSDTSDGDFPVIKKICKRQRLISRSSNETVVIEQNSFKSDEERPTKLRKNEQIINTKPVSDIECVNIEDSDSASTKSSVKVRDSEAPVRPKTSTINDKMINNIITMCSTKYMNRLNASDGGNAPKEESSLKHKILSVGRKVIHNKGTSATGLLRYMEHKNLEVIWVPKMDSKVTIKTRPKESTDYENSNFGWENITTLHNCNYIAEDFTDIFERTLVPEASLDKNRPHRTQSNQSSSSKDRLTEIEKELTKDECFNNPQKTTIQATDSLNIQQESVETESAPSDSAEKKVSDNSYLRAALDSEKNWKKLLNANPVANPKQLPKKNNISDATPIVAIYSEDTTDPGTTSIPETSVNADTSHDVIHMPIITSTISLAAPIDKHPNNINTTIQNTENISDINKCQATLPKIKVKPVSELMSERVLSQQNNAFASMSNWSVTNETQSQNAILHTTNSNLVFMTTSPSYSNVIPINKGLICYPERQDVVTTDYNIAAIADLSGSTGMGMRHVREYVKLHTVELPNTKTDSPIQYFQQLLQTHNMLLVDGTQMQPTMHCLTKFKVIFEQESNVPVKLCLFLFCKNNVFCIKAQDHFLKDLDIPSFSANWQWELLKVFKGTEIVPKILLNASKFGTHVLNMTNYFLNLLKSIIFSKEL